MSGDVQVRFCERLGVGFPRATHLLLGFAGPKAEAEEIREKLASFLQQELKLTLSPDKTLVTHAQTEQAHFLGYEIRIMSSQTKHDHRQRRMLNGKVGLYIPEGLVEKKRQRFLRNGKGIHRAELIQNHEYHIVQQYQWEYRGLVEYYALAQNLSSLSILRWTMETSLLKTLANKFRTTVVKTLKRLRSTWKTPHGPRRCLKVTIPREGNKPLTAVFGGLSLRRRPNANIQDQAIMPYIHKRSEVITRLLRSTCEVCGSTENVEIHHIRRLANLKIRGRREKPLWMQIMITRKRKTLAVCRKCHMDIQYNRPRSRKSGYRRAG